MFLDRDGTINVKAADNHYITSPEELVLLPGAGRAIATLNAASIPTVLVSNQRWLSEPGVEPIRYDAIQARLEELLAGEGARLDASYHCPHPIGKCECRKPSPGMLLRAAREHGFELTGAVIVGDSEADVLAGRAAGTATILLRAETSLTACADVVVGDLEAAVRLMLPAAESGSDRSGIGRQPG